MQMAGIGGELILNFTEHYMESLFYFCLKKTGNTVEAEDLTHDTALHILTALQRGVIPAHFSAWVWQIARNRYAAWAAKKHLRTERQSTVDIAEYEIEGADGNPLDGMIDAEQTALLRRELAFIRREYRDMIVAYYIENRSIHDIAQANALSVSAVQQRLHRARTILKEGMDMARTFGKRSYNPEEITFAASGSQPSGLPWTAVQRSIPKNILLQASNNPSTAEELSVELGIALPYMEEEIALLCNATLLEKQGDKYITNFFILDRDCRLDIYNALRRGAKDRSALIRELIADTEEKIAALGMLGAHMGGETLRWWLIPHITDMLIESTVRGESIYEPPVRANGETWGFVGYEMAELPESTMMSHNGAGDEQNMFLTYKYPVGQMWDQCGEPNDYELVMLLADCIRKNRTTASFSDGDARMWERIDGRYAHADENGSIIPDILVFRGGMIDALEAIIRGHKNFANLTENMTAAYHTVEMIFKQYSHRVLHSHIGYYIRMELYAARMMTVHDLLTDGFLTVPADPTKSTFGMHLILT